MKLSLNISLIVSVLYALLNYSWVHAASLAALSGKSTLATSILQGNNRKNRRSFTGVQLSLFLNIGNAVMLWF